MTQVLSVHWLRGLSALLVVFFHVKDLFSHNYKIENLVGILFGQVNFGIDLFFLISGFIMVYSTTVENRCSALHFLIKRFFRIFPIFIFCLILVFLIEDRSANIYSLKDYIKTALLIHKDYNGPAPAFSFMPVGRLYQTWTLPYEVYFYLVFAAGIFFSYRYRVFLVCAYLILSVFVIQLFFNHSISFNSEYKLSFYVSNSYEGILKIASNPLLLDCLFGCVIAKIYLYGELVRNKLIVYLFFLSSLIYFFSYYFSLIEVGTGSGSLSHGMWSFFLLCSFLGVEKYCGLKDIKILSFLGDVSYALYVSHTLIIFVLFEMIGFKLEGVFDFILVIGCCIGFGTILHFLVEKPFITLGRNLIRYNKNRRLQETEKMEKNKKMDKLDLAEDSNNLDGLDDADGVKV